MSTYDALVGILTTRFKVPQADVALDVTFETLGMDSLFLVELLVVVEQELGVRIDDDKLLPTDTIETLTGLVDAQLAEGSRSS